MFTFGQQIKQTNEFLAQSTGHHGKFKPFEQEGGQDGAGEEDPLQ